MLEHIRNIYDKEKSPEPKNKLSDWEKMEKEIKTNFPNFDFVKYEKPVKDWFKIRTVLNLSLTFGEEFDLTEINRNFDFKYEQFIDDEDFIKISGYITNKLGKKSSTIKVK